MYMTGQIIPKGLHVRLNLETGEKEAKLMSSRPPRSAGIEQNVILITIFPVACGSVMSIYKCGLLQRATVRFAPRFTLCFLSQKLLQKLSYFPST